MYRTEIIKSLLDATLLVHKAVNKKISFMEFIEKYDNFYHHAALDGHEANGNERDVFEEFRVAVDLHEKIQMEIIDQVYMGEANRKLLKDSGRIDLFEASRRIREIGSEFDIEPIMKLLRLALGSCGTE